MGDSVFIGSCNGFFRKLDANTGKVQWETNVRPDAAKQYFFHGDTFMASDRIVASTDVDTKTGTDAGVHAFDRGSGRLLWKFSAGRGVLGAIAGAGSRVFAYTTAGDLIALDLATGTSAWTYALKADPWESPGTIDDRVVAASTDGTVYTLDARSGRVLWQKTLGAPIAGSIRASGADIYVGTSDGSVHRLAAGSGDLRASLKLDGVLRPVSAPVRTKDAVLVLLADKEANYRALVSLDPGLTRVKWRQQAAERWTTSRVFVTERTVVVGSPSGEVTAYCAADGSLAWSHRLTKEPIRSIGGTDDGLMAGTPSGALFALRPPRACM